MSMIHEGETQYETDVMVKRMVDATIRKHGEAVPEIGRWALMFDELFVSVKTPKARAEPKAKSKKSPPPRAGEVVGPAPEAEPEQPKAPRKPPHLVVCRWIRPPAAVQVHLAGAKLGRGQAQFLEVRWDLWALMSDSDREAAIMTALLQREVVDDADGGVKVRKADLPIQTHPAVERAHGRWWEHMDPGSAAPAPDDG